MVINLQSSNGKVQKWDNQSDALDHLFTIFSIPEQTKLHTIESAKLFLGNC
ncbi:hypothetical protein ACN23B_14530 [Anabaena sp. FACHB-709]|uniref:Uncharacterized protein n=1 Tax=Anabaena cylindrica FACHB-318 TaxID=2692880 RepID=A0ABR7ZHS4_ANACY|nr:MULTISPECIES: hypothetical protein [Nostocaceae]MBD2171666.1 hypothetical protein [Anabaena cylindrica FACHB-318]MBD2264185.1 hypothetical protein [Anabaena sp. FACHB-709]MBD2273528.1 hypothetical protein [Nostoc sp. PCC 7120 = FACHB-418]MBD2281731.1 hypothetical protein [Anabaena cylindrica FACHB-170]MBD2347557.1 hypothetical protein [Trichormus variabilis FACHB-171]